MAKNRGNPNITNVGKKFSKDYQPEKNGRPRNVFTKYHGMFECSVKDVEAVLTELISLSVEELQDIARDKKTEALRSCIAQAIISDRKLGSLNGVNFLISRLFGSTVQKVENTVSINTDEKAVADVLSKYGVTNTKD